MWALQQLVLWPPWPELIQVGSFKYFKGRSTLAQCVCIQIPLCLYNEMIQLIIDSLEKKNNTFCPMSIFGLFRVFSFESTFEIQSRGLVKSGQWIKTNFSFFLTIKIWTIEILCCWTLPQNRPCLTQRFEGISFIWKVIPRNTDSEVKLIKGELSN